MGSDASPMYEDQRGSPGFVLAVHVRFKVGGVGLHAKHAKVNRRQEGWLSLCLTVIFLMIPVKLFSQGS